MNDKAPGTRDAGLLVSLRRLIATALELAQVRLELIGTELEAQKLRILAGLIWAVLGTVLVGVGLVLLAGWVLLLFWEGYRLPALAAMTLLFLGGGALVLRYALARLKTPPGAFSLSAAELAQDRAALRPREGDAATPP